MIRVRLPARRVVSTAAILTVGIFAVPERLLTQELPLAPMRASGQSVTAAYEGWFRDSDGQVSLLVGYFNRNTEEVLDIPVGPDNRIDLRSDLGQPAWRAPGAQPAVAVASDSS